MEKQLEIMKNLNIYNIQFIIKKTNQNRLHSLQNALCY